MISIVLTYYNGSRFIKEQIESLCEQSLSFDELLIFDDCSSSDQFNYLKKYIESREENITLIRNKENYGYAKNFVNGCKYANNDYVFLCDQDDIWDKDKLKCMVNVMESNSDINLLSCDIEPFYYSNNSPKWDTNNLKTMLNDGTVERMDVSIQNSHIMRSGSAMCFRKRFFDSILPYWIEGWAHDDFLWKCALFTNSCALLHKKLMKRRIHDSNTSELLVRTKEWRIQELSEMKDQLLALKRYIKDSGTFNPDYEVIIKHNIEGLDKRIHFLKGHNPFLWFVCATKYKDTYPRIKGLFLDLFLYVFKIYKR